MKVLLQRVSRASVAVDGEVISSIGRGLLLLTGFGQHDAAQLLKPMAEKLANLRIFSDEQGRFQHSLLDVKGAALVVPQFTLFADTRKGRRPEFSSALEPQAASALCDAFLSELRAAGIAEVRYGKFGAHMQVALENDGPVTIMLES